MTVHDDLLINLFIHKMDTVSNHELSFCQDDETLIVSDTCKWLFLDAQGWMILAT